MQIPVCSKCAEPMQIVRLVCRKCEVSTSGSFDLPALAQLDEEEQRFVSAFVRLHGNIRKMEALLKISYPTVKNRLNAIAAKLERLERPIDRRGEILERLARGDLTIDQALEQL